MLFLPLKLALKFVRIAGIRGLFFLALGVGVGLLIAPTSGARLRAKIKARLEAAGVELPADPGPAGSAPGSTT